MEIVFTDQEQENNNQQEKTESEVSGSVKTESPVLTVDNLPKVYRNRNIPFDFEMYI